MLVDAIYGQVDLEDFELADAVKRRYRKQVAYAGEFVKKRPGAKDLEFSIDIPTLDHWEKTFKEFQEDGIEVPMPLGHTEDPEKRRGTVVGAARGLDDKGRESLFFDIEFIDADAERLKSSNTSIYVPPEFTSGKKKKYSWPIRHLAITDYPVLPGLAPFQAVALSMELAFPPAPAPAPAPVPTAAPAAAGEQAVLLQIAKMLGLQVVGTETPEQLGQMIMAKLKPPTPAVPAVPPRPAIAAGFLSMAKELRQNKIRALIGKHITKACADDLEAAYCKDDVLSLSLSNDGSTSDNFDLVLAAAAKNEPFKVGERSAAQLSQASRLAKAEGKEGDENPLVTNAKKRAEAAKTTAN